MKEKEKTVVTIICIRMWVVRILFTWRTIQVKSNDTIIQIFIWIKTMSTESSGKLLKKQAAIITNGPNIIDDEHNIQRWENN